MQLVFTISDGWSISWDHNQWILQRMTGKENNRRWKPVAFIASSKAAMLTRLKEEHIELTKTAATTIAHWPDTFKEWKQANGL